MEAIKALRQWIVFFCPPVDEGRYRGTANLDLLYSPQQKEQAAPGRRVKPCVGSRDSSPWRSRLAWLSLRLGASLYSILLMPAELNSVSDSRRHYPTKRIGSINAEWGGVRWVLDGV